MTIDDMTDAPKLARQTLMGSRIVTIALLLGMLTFLGVVLFLTHEDGPRGDPDTVDVLNLTGFVISVAAVIGSRIVNALALRRIDPMVRVTTPEDVVQRCQRYMTSKILQLAPLEGMGLYWGVVLLIGGDQRAGIGVIVAAVMVSMRYPTEGRFERVTGLSLDSDDREDFRDDPPAG